MEKEFLTIKETATMLGVTTLTLRNWDKADKFTASRHPINNYRVYKKAEVLMFIEDLKSKSWKIKTPESQVEKTSENRDAGRSAKKLSVTHLEN